MRFRSLIRKHAALAKAIKDLKDLSVLRVCAGYRHSGPTDLKRTRDVFSVARAMARDRPSPYGEGAGVIFTVARGPVPRERWTARTISRPGGLSYGDIVRIKTGRALLHRFMKHPDLPFLQFPPRAPIGKLPQVISHIFTDIRKLRYELVIPTKHN